MTRPAQLLRLVDQPDVLFLLGLDPEASIKRIAARIDSRQTDEDEILLAEAREMYLRLAASVPECEPARELSWRDAACDQKPRSAHSGVTPGRHVALGDAEQ